MTDVVDQLVQKCNELLAKPELCDWSQFGAWNAKLDQLNQQLVAVFEMKEKLRVRRDELNRQLSQTVEKMESQLPLVASGQLPVAEVEQQLQEAETNRASVDDLKLLLDVVTKKLEGLRLESEQVLGKINNSMGGATTELGLGTA